MSRKNEYVFWSEVLYEVDGIAFNLRTILDSTSRPSVDFGHGIAERIRQLARDLEPPVGPVIKHKGDVE